MRNDIKIAAKIIQILDKRNGLWDEPEQEKKDEEKEVRVRVILICTTPLKFNIKFTAENYFDITLPDFIGIIITHLARWHSRVCCFMYYCNIAMSL